MNETASPRSRGQVASATQCIAEDVRLGAGVVIHEFVNLYGCDVGEETQIGPFVEIQKGVRIGRRCKISSHSFVCEGVTVEDEAFIGHGVMFINDQYPRATTATGEMQREQDWVTLRTTVERGASIGSGSTVLGGITIGAGALVGAGSVITKSVPSGQVWAGNPARYIREV